MRDHKPSLNEYTDKKIETLTIGVISEIEQLFGLLWGIHKRNRDNLTDDEKHFDIKWSILRKKILDRGGKTRRDIMDYNRSQ